MISCKCCYILRTPILQNIYKRRNYLCENIYHMAFFVTVYLAKKCLCWCLPDKQEKRLYLSEVYNILVICKKLYLEVKGRLHISLLKKLLFRGKIHIDFNLLLFQYLHFISLGTSSERKSER